MTGAQVLGAISRMRRRSCCMRVEGIRHLASPKDVTMTRQVLSYFVRNPQAIDSVEGVARWRLLDEAIHVQVNTVREALGWLVERGVLREVAGPGLQPVFSLDPDRRDEAERLLAELTAAQEPPREER
jgi:hypothetical protein